MTVTTTGSTQLPPQGDGANARTPKASRVVSGPAPTSEPGNQPKATSQMYKAKSGGRK